MWVLLFVVCTLFPSLLCKEYLPSEGVVNDEKSILPGIIKRLEESSFREDGQPEAEREQDGHGDDGDEIEFGNLALNDGQIIRSDDSNGARFLVVFQNVDSNTSCADLCHKNSSCDTAVYENKDKHRCFLFSCGGHCILSKNKNYISSTIDRHNMSSAPTPAAAMDNEETVDLDLDLDANGSNISRSDDDENNRDGSVADSSESLESVLLKGDDTTTTSTSSVSTTSAAPTVTAALFLPHTVRLGGSCHSDVHCKDPWAVCNLQKCLCQQGFRQKDNVCQKQGPPDSELGAEEEKPLNTGEDKPEENQHRLEEQTQPDSEGRQVDKNHHGSEEESKPSPKEDTQKEDSVSSEEEAIDSTHQPTGNRTVPSVGTTTVPHTKYIFIEEVAEIIADGDLQVPIIALSVGLIFTLLLLLFVACRLCRVRRQLRKSRPLHCNEADYLINGMYL